VVWYGMVWYLFKVANVGSGWPLSLDLIRYMYELKVSITCQVMMVQLELTKCDAICFSHFFQ